MATSLNALSMVIGMNTDQVTAGVGSIRQQLGRANRIMQMSKTAGDKLTEGVVALATAYQRGALSQSQYAKGMDSLQSKYLKTSQVSKEAAESEQRVNRLVAQSTPEVAKLTANMRDLITAKRQGKISAEQFGHAEEMLKGQMQSLKAAEEKQRAELDGTAEAARQAEARLRRVQQTVAASVPPTTRLAQQIRELRKEYADGNVNADQFTRSNRRLMEQYRQLQDAEKRHKAELDGTAEAARQADARLRRVQQTVQSTVPKTTQLAMQIRELRQEYKAGNISADQFTRANVKLRAQYDQLKTGAHSAGNSMAVARRKFDEWRQSVRQATSEMQPMLQRLSALAATYLSFRSIGGLASITNEFTQGKISLEVFTGSAEQAASVLGEIRSFAADSPLSFGDAIKASTTMLAFGSAAESVVPKLRMLGDISGGNAERFQSLSLAFSQTQAAGRLMGQEVLQFVNAGFNPLQQISEDTGISMGVLKKRMEEGAISFEMVEEAMRSATSEGGRFYGMTEKQANTAGGAVNQLVSASRELAAQFGSVFEPAVRDVAKSLKGMVEWIKQIGSGLTEGQAKTVAFIGAFAGGVVVAKSVISVISGIISVVRALTVAQITLQAFMGPAGWASIAAGAAIAAGAVWAVNKAYEETTENMKESSGATEEAAESARRASSVYDSLRDSVSQTAGPMQNLLQSYMDQNLALALGADYAERAKAAREGATQSELDELKRQQERNALLQEEKRIREENERKMEQAAEKALRDQEKRLKDLVKAGQEVRDSLRSPFEVAADEIGRLMMLLRGGFIDQATYAQATNKVADEFSRDQRSSAPAAITAGSTEAYRFVVDQTRKQQDRNLAAMERQRLIAEAQLRQQEKLNTQIARLETVGLL